MRNKVVGVLNEKGSRVLARMGLPPSEMAKLEKIPLIVGLSGIFINLLLLSSRFDVAWSKGYAIYQGEPFEVYASLSSVMFGTSGQFTSSIAGCPEGTMCSLDILAGDCTDGEALDVDLYPISKRLAHTSAKSWCELRDAGSTTGGLLW